MFNYPKGILTGSLFFISATMASDFFIPSGSLQSSSIAYVMPQSAILNEKISFWIYDVTYPFTIVNSGSSPSTLFTSSDVPVKTSLLFQSGNWTLFSTKRLGTSESSIQGQIPTLEDLGLVFDLNLGQTSSFIMHPDGVRINYVFCEPSSLVLTGSGHEVYKETGSWSTGAGDVCVGRFIDLVLDYEEYHDVANNYLNGKNNAIFDVFNSTTSSWNAWSIFFVFKNTSTSSKYQGLFALRQDATTRIPMIGVEIDNSGSLGTGYRLALASTNGATISSVYIDTTLDTERHLIEISSDGAGNIDVWFDGQHKQTVSDIRPRSINEMNIGSSWEGSPTYGQNAKQFDGLIARFMIFDENLISTNREYVRNLLNVAYDIF